jgi:hypothetical protein
MHRGRELASRRGSLRRFSGRAGSRLRHTESWRRGSVPYEPQRTATLPTSVSTFMSMFSGCTDGPWEPDGPAQARVADGSWSHALRQTPGDSPPWWHAGRTPSYVLERDSRFTMSVSGTVEIGADEQHDRLPLWQRVTSAISLPARVGGRWWGGLHAGTLLCSCRSWVAHRGRPWSDRNDSDRRPSLSSLSTTMTAWVLQGRAWPGSVQPTPLHPMLSDGQVST